jgi:hypothetical protein
MRHISASAGFPSAIALRSVLALAGSGEPNTYVEPPPPKVSVAQPLVIASGAGAASRQAIGTAVVGGMIAATVISLIFTPVFYVVMQSLSERIRRSKHAQVTAGPMGEPPESTSSAGD